MSKTNDNLQEIKGTLEEIRLAQFADVSSDIIQKIVDEQFANQEQDSRINGRTATHQIVKAYIDEVCKEGEDA